MVSTIMRAFDLVFGVIGMFLILRIVLQIFRVPRQNPFFRFLEVVTDPIVNQVNRILGIPAYRQYDLSTIAMLAASAIVIWVLRALVMWPLQFVNDLQTRIMTPMGIVGFILREILRLTFDLYSMALFVRILFEWVRIPYSSKVMRFLWDITEPVLAPIRRAIPSYGGLDFSPLIAFFLLNLLEGGVFMMLGWIF